jgi:hypothetical protein
VELRPVMDQLSKLRMALFSIMHWWNDSGLVTVKVKFTLEQATKAQRESRGIALLFH